MIVKLRTLYFGSFTYLLFCEPFCGHSNFPWSSPRSENMSRLVKNTQWNSWHSSGQVRNTQRNNRHRGRQMSSTQRNTCSRYSNGQVKSTQGNSRYRSRQVRRVNLTQEWRSGRFISGLYVEVISIWRPQFMSEIFRKGFGRGGQAEPLLIFATSIVFLHFQPG